MYNKKGLSAIVATVLIILLVIAGVTLVWTPVRKLITSQSEELEASCLLTNPTITKACMRVNDLEITISNGAEGDIDNVQIIYGDDETSLVYTNTPSPAVAIGINQIQTAVVISASGTPDVVRIAAVIAGDTCLAGSITSGIQAAPACT